VNSGPDRVSLRWIMTFAQRKHLLLAAWVATIAVVGVILAIDRPELWILVAALALVPAAIGNWFWKAPEATLSQLIAAARSRS
jgi:hypothetical protein